MTMFLIAAVSCPLLVWTVRRYWFAAGLLSKRTSTGHSPLPKMAFAAPQALRGLGSTPTQTAKFIAVNVLFRVETSCTGLRALNT